jgi:hypothetical protein
VTQLFDVLVQVAREVESLVERPATGGSDSTILDSQLNTVGLVDDSLNGGTAFVIYDAAGLGAAPEKQSRFITDYVGISGTITVSPVFSVAVAAGDVYGVSTNRYPRSSMVTHINAALRAMGIVPVVDTSSLTTVAGQTEYSLPVASKRALRQVWLARATAAPYDWERQLRVRREFSAPNVAGTLIFPEQPRVGYKIKLIYMAPHGYVQADADYISDYISVEWLALEAAVGCVRQRLQGSGAEQKQLTQLINDLMARAERAKPGRLLENPAAFPILP